MARVKVSDIVDHVSSEGRAAMRDALEQVAPGSSVDATELFRAFVRRLYSRTSVWENVPDRYVDVD